MSWGTLSGGGGGGGGGPEHGWPGGDVPLAERSDGGGHGGFGGGWPGGDVPLAGGRPDGPWVPGRSS